MSKENEKKKHVLITWHYTTHGIAYLKHILSAFHQKYVAGETPKLDRVKGEKFDQVELSGYFDKNAGNFQENGFKFDKIIFLTAPQEAFDNLSSRRHYRNAHATDDETQFGLNECFEKMSHEEFFRVDMDKERAFFKENFPDKVDDFEKFQWRNIQYYPVSEQIRWLLEKSNFCKVYKPSDFEERRMDINDLRDEEKIVNEVSKLMKETNEPDTVYFINISLGSNETQVAWHVLSHAGLLPSDTHFIKTYDSKEVNPTERFKPFTIREVGTNLLEEISLRLYPGTQSPRRMKAQKEMSIYLKSGFSILLLGERGIGKSRLAIEQKQDDGHFIMVNCASFADDTMAESELFGYKKGAFTGATSDKVGLIKEAENGILFFDEIHSLSRRVQSKLMTALQTDENNKLHIRRLGDNKEIKVNQVKLIFASNRTIQELRDCLLPDFFDRIVQQVIELPPLRQCMEERENDWKQIWEQMKFDKDKKECPTDAKFMRWLKSLELWGNYRDLQRIAIHYHNYLVIKGTPENQDILTDDNNQPLSALEYVKEHFEKYNNPISDTEIFPCQIQYGKAQDMIKNFQHQLGEKMVEKYGSRKKAAIALGVDEKTITNWKKQHSQP